MLRLEGLRRTHPGARAPAVSDVTLDVARGEVLVVVGPSGCGKSTILRLIAGLDEPTAGRVVLDGVDMGAVPPERRDVAMVFQGYALYPNLTARENMAFPLRMRGVSKPERRARVAEVAKLLDVERLLDRRPDQLSGGERQRIAMGRAIVRKPKVFLFDEPLSNLDASLRATLRTDLAALLRRLEATAIYVTHDQVEAMTVGHRIAVMSRGQVEQAGSPRDIYERPLSLFVAGFLGAPPINVVAIERGEGGSRVLGSAIAAPANATKAAIRPERIAIRTAHGDDIAWDARIDVVEPLGAESVLHCAVDATTLRLTETGFSTRTVGERVSLAVPRAAFHFFGDDGLRIDLERT